MYFFCTYFDRNYLARGLTLYRSLQQHCPSSRLWVLCMDDFTHDKLVELDLPGLTPIALKDLERSDPRLLEAKPTRSKIEYYFTCTPSLPLYVLEGWPEVDVITYLDADLFFFADPKPLFDHLGNASIAITPHSFSPALKDRERYGIFNVGWVSFRRDADGLGCIGWWRERCLEWCFDREEANRFGDQKYLDNWPVQFNNVVVLTDKGANLAPWNVDNYELRVSSEGNVTVDGEELIFFHFHALTQAGRWVYDPSWHEYGVHPSPVLTKKIYLPYLRALFATKRSLLSSTDEHPITTSSRVWRPEQQATTSPLRRSVRQFRHVKSLAREVLAGNMIFLP